MRTFRQILLFAAIVAVSGLALLALLPWMKEGASLSALPFVLGGLLLLVLLGGIWWLACGRSLPKAVAGWIVLTVPGLAYGALAVSLVAGHFGGLRLARNVRIENFSEAPILWPGFDGPVGLAMNFEIVHPKGVSALILPPEIRMGPEIDIPRGALSATRTNGSGTFKDSYLEAPAGNLTLLKTVLFQRLYENGQAEREYEKWSSAYRFEADGRTKLAYALHPGALDYLEEPARLCLSNQTPGIPRCAAGEDPRTAGCASRFQRPPASPLYHQGRDLTALWVAAGQSNMTADMTADLSPVLTATLRLQSSLQGDPDAWTAMQQRLEPAGLLEAGYGLCPPGDNSHSALRTCYCRPAPE